MDQDNDFIMCYTILKTLHDAFLAAEDWKGLRKEGVIKNLEIAMDAIKPGYEKEMAEEEPACGK